MIPPARADHAAKHVRPVAEAGGEGVQKTRVQRRGQQVYEGKIDSLRHVKDIVKEISAPQECGVSVTGFNSFQDGDILQCFVQEQIKRTIG